MKRIVFIIISLLTPLALVSQSEEVATKTFLNNAVQKATIENKPIILEFWAPSCGPCIQLKRDIFENKSNSEFLEKNFVLMQISPADSIYNTLWKNYNLIYQSSIIFLDKYGNEIDRTASYDGNRVAYLNYLHDIAKGINLYKNIYQAYIADSLNILNNYLLAKKMYFRYELRNAIKQFENVIGYDPDNKFGFNLECRFKVAESDYMLTGKLGKMVEFTKIEQKNAFAPAAYVYLINDLIKKRDQLNCILLCDEALLRYPDSWEILNAYAWAIYTFKIKEKYTNAVNMALKSISLNPDRAGTYSTAAWIYYEMGEKSKAAEIQRKGIEIYPHPTYLRDLELFSK